jgi:hypothetical protein
LKEAQSFGCNPKDGESSELCACIETKLFELGQDKIFSSYVSDESKCGTSVNARHRVIGFLKVDAYAICNNFMKCSPYGWASASGNCPIYMTCWDGTILNPRNPCDKTCPVLPKTFLRK